MKTPVSKEYLSKIEQILYYGIQGGKTEEDANSLVDYVQWAHEENLEKVPKDYQEFAQLMKHHWPDVADMSQSNRKVHIQKQLHGLLETLQQS